jgi:hypothetical protein
MEKDRKSSLKSAIGILTGLTLLVSLAACGSNTSGKASGGSAGSGSSQSSSTPKTTPKDATKDIGGDGSLITHTYLVIAGTPVQTAAASKPASTSLSSYKALSAKFGGTVNGEKPQVVDTGGNMYVYTSSSKSGALKGSKYSVADALKDFGNPVVMAAMTDPTSSQVTVSMIFGATTVDLTSSTQPRHVTTLTFDEKSGLLFASTFMN